MSMRGRPLRVIRNATRRHNEWETGGVPNIIVVAGPNGAGKTSFIRQFLPIQQRTFVYANADEIERSLDSRIVGSGARAMAAGRQMLAMIEREIEAHHNLMIETTLATRRYARKFAEWRAAGYSVGLIYLRLHNADQAIDRVARRVRAGGHHIPEEVIRRRFATSLEYLDSIYKLIVDEWYVWDSVEGDFEPVESWEQR